MTAGSVIKFTILGCLINLHNSSGLSQEIHAVTYRLVFYNVENLFDARDDSLTDDNEFLPSGVMHWTETRYRHKISSIYKVLTAAGEWNPPALAGFCEVENKRVLQALVFDTWLSKYNYGVVTGESNDPRGIRPGIIYRKDLMRLLFCRSIRPVPETSEEFRSRKILYTKWLVKDDTIHLFLNHWPSRRRGVMAEEKVRRSISSVLKNTIDSLYLTSGHAAKIIIAGDFNCTPDDPEIRNLCLRTKGDQKDQFLVNLSSDRAEMGEGTFKYMGKWEMIDQVLASRGILDPVKGIYTGKEFFRIFRPDFIMQKDASYPGYRPFPTYRGFRYQGGFSDHLPVILDLKIR
jgi:Endonuclease/Exonuclease/phosphatase family